MTGYVVPQGAVGRVLFFLMVSSSDHINGVPGIASSISLVMVRANATSYTPLGPIADCGNGVYAYVTAGGDLTVLGPLWLHASAPGCDPMDCCYQVVGYNPDSGTNLGLTNLDATVSSRSTFAAGDDVGNVTGSVAGPVASVTAPVLISSGTGVGQIDLTNGTVNAVGNVLGSVTGPVGGVSQPVIVGGYTPGNDPGYMVLDVPMSGHMGAGTVGARIGQNMAAAVLDVPMVDHIQSLSVGWYISAGSQPPIVPDPWLQMLPHSYIPGSAGYILGTWLDAAVSSRSTFAGGTVSGVVNPVTVGGYASGQSPATLVLDAQMSAHMGIGTVGASIASGGEGLDPWATTLPGAYPLGSAGAILGVRLDAQVSTRSTYAGGAVASVTAPVTVGGYSLGHDPATLVLDAQMSAHMGVGTVGASIASGGEGGDPWLDPLPGAYPPGTAGAILGGYLDVAVSTRSTFAGGAVASVTNPVTAGTVSDKAGYALAPAGLDLISTVPPSGVANNFREMLVQLWRRWFGQARKDATLGTIQTYQNDNATVMTTQLFSDDGQGNEFQGPAT